MGTSLPAERRQPPRSFLHANGCSPFVFFWIDPITPTRSLPYRRCRKKGDLPHSPRSPTLFVSTSPPSPPHPKPLLTPFNTISSFLPSPPPSPLPISFSPPPHDSLMSCPVIFFSFITSSTGFPFFSANPFSRSTSPRPMSRKRFGASPFGPHFCFSCKNDSLLFLASELFPGSTPKCGFLHGESFPFSLVNTGYLPRSNGSRKQFSQRFRDL